MKRAIIIARVSSDEQARGTSPETQIEACQGFARDHGYEVSPEDVLREDGVSGGTDLDARPIPKAALERLKQGEIAAIIFYDLDRAGRTLRTAELIEESRRYGDGILLVRKPPTDDIIGEVISLGAGALVAKIERYMIAERFIRGRRDVAKRGGYSGGGRPFWLIPPDNEHLGEAGNEWRLDEEKAATVRQIFDLALHGDPETGESMGADRICRHLDKKGIRPPRGGKQWNVGPVLAILHNEAACGVFRQLTGTKAKLLPAGDPVPVEVPPVVTREQWDAVQERLRLRRNYRGTREKRRWLLTGGLLRCSEDGFYYQCNGKKGHLRAYYCPGRTGRRRSGCQAPWIKADRLEQEIAKRLRDLLADSANAEHAVRRYIDTLEERRASLQAAVGPVQEKLQDIARRRQRLMAAYADGLEEEDYRKRRRQLDTEQARLEAQAADRKKGLRDLKAVERDLGEIRASLDAGVLRAELESLGDEVKETFYTAHANGTPVEPDPSPFRRPDADEWSDWVISWYADDPDGYGARDGRVDRRFVRTTSLRELLQRLGVRLTAYPDGHVEAEGRIPLGEFTTLQS